MLRIIVILIAIGASGLTSWLATKQPSRTSLSGMEQAPKIAMEEVLVAASDLPPGKILEAVDFRWTPWPADAAAASFIRRSLKPDAIATYEGAATRSQFVSGEPFREDKLTLGPSGLLAAILPSGKRAIAIRVTAESTAGGFILPNDRVDVIQTSSSETGDRRENLSRTLLMNIRVLAVDQQATDGKEKAVVAKTVTLELDPKQAELIATAQASGVLSLALRSASDSSEQTVIAPPDNAIRVVRGGRVEFVRAQ